jgi:hypothetical protein
VSEARSYNGSELEAETPPPAMVSKLLSRERMKLKLMTLLLIAACGRGSTGDDVRAINLVTGETKNFANAESVPEGWTTCDSECPEPPACEGLDEAACLARSDCFPAYVGFWPMECESPNPPAFCAELPYFGCGPIPEESGDGTVHCGVIHPDGTSEEVPCDDACAGIPQCELLCPEGTSNPVDENGCVHTCECESDETTVTDPCGDPPTCEPCADGYLHDDQGCQTCECAPPPPPPGPCDDLDEATCAATEGCMPVSDGQGYIGCRPAGG